jgi:hypothetical protein
MPMVFPAAKVPPYNGKPDQTSGQKLLHNVNKITQLIGILKRDGLPVNLKKLSIKK